MDLGTLFSLIIQAKKAGKGHLENGRIYIMLMQAVADKENDDISSELDILRKFSNSTITLQAYYLPLHKTHSLKCRIENICRFDSYFIFT